MVKMTCCARKLDDMFGGRGKKRKWTLISRMLSAHTLLLISDCPPPRQPAYASAAYTRIDAPPPVRCVSARLPDASVKWKGGGGRGGAGGRGGGRKERNPRISIFQFPPSSSSSFSFSVPVGQCRWRRRQGRWRPKE